MAFAGFDTDVYPGDAALRDAAAQGFSWCNAYLEAPSHSNGSWPDYTTLTASGLNPWPIWVGGQVTGPGSHAVSDAAGAAEATACADEMDAKGYPPDCGVVFDTENGPPIPPNQQEHLAAWRDGLRARGRKPQGYGSHRNFDALAAIFGADNVFTFDILGSPPATFQGIAVQYEQNVPLVLAGQTFIVDRSVSLTSDPAGHADAPIVVAPPTVQIPVRAIEPPPVTPIFPPQPPKPTPKLPVIQAHGPLIAAGATAVAAAGAGATGATHVIDFTALVNALAPYLIVGVLLPGAIWIGGRVLQKLGIDTQSSAGQAVTRALENGVNALASAGVTYADAHASVDVHNAYVASVLSYANATVPARIAASGITPAQLAALATNRLSQIGATS